MLIFVLRFLTNPRQRRWVALLILCAALLAMPSMALAHGDGGISPETAARAWSWPLHMVIGLALLALVYSRGVRNVWTRAGIGRGIRWGQVAAFAGAVILLAAAVFSPLDAMSDALLSAHMTQHMLLIFAVAPLLVVSDLPLALMWALPRRRAQTIARWWENQPRLRDALGWLDQVVVAWLLFAGLLWLWHLPAFYEAALHETWIHELEHALFLASAYGFWWVLARRLHRRMYLPVMVALFAALLQGVALSALLIFAGRPLYDAYASTTGAWGLSPLEDQQLAGVIMGLPGHVLLLAVLIAVAYRWIDEPSVLQGETTRQHHKVRHGL